MYTKQKQSNLNMTNVSSINATNIKLSPINQSKHFLSFFADLRLIWIPSKYGSQEQIG